MSDDKKPPQTDQPSQQPGDSAEQAAAAEPMAAEKANGATAGMSKKRRHQGRHLMDVVVPRAWIFGMLAGLLTIFVVMAIGFATLTNPAACSTCHVISKEYDSFLTSTHNVDGVTCQDCHVKPGIFNYFVYNLRSLTHVYTLVADTYEKPIVTYVGVANCVKCHPKEEIEQDVIVGNIRVNHKGLREAGMQCMTCHSDVVHGDAVPVGSRPIGNKMSICGRCHNGVIQPRTCSICHVGGVPEGTAKVEITAQISGKNCTECHRTDFCSGKCHNGVTMPHIANWPQMHGKEVIASPHGAATCANCHQKKDPTFCISCHGLKMPHESGWEGSHGPKAQKDPTVCAKCHGTNSCNNCHGLTMPHPASWQSTHGATAKSNSATCSKCHSSSFCTNCHGVSLPHSSSWLTTHYDPVYAGGAVCVKCHGNGGTGASGCYGGACHSGSQ